MCGIAGFLSFEHAQRPRLEHVVSMTRAMRHRGPDDEGYIVRDADNRIRRFVGEDSPPAVRARYPNSGELKLGTESRSNLVLGHRRLSIQDVSPLGHQPMEDSSGRYWIVYNGEIYNFIELREELKNLGCVFRSGTDTEVILSSYKQWGDKCLSRFNGDFAFALWDNEQQVLFCARDRIGIKPFYYVYTENQFVFASDIKTLIASGLYSPEPDPSGLYLSMAFGIAPRPITAFKGVRALEQAHWMKIHRNGEIDKQRYWRIPTCGQDRKMQENEAVELLDEKLTQAIKRRLLSDVPVGTFMSGGIDSSTMSAIAAQLKPGIKAFTLGYNEEASELDEVQQAQDTAALHSMEHIIERVEPESCLHNLGAWVEGYEEPYYSLAPNHVISELASENDVTVVLNGLGGDELLAGYGYYRYHWLPRMPLLHPLVSGFRDSQLEKSKLVRGLALMGAKSADRVHTMLFMHTGDDELRRLFVPDFVPEMSTPDILHQLYADDVEFTDNVEAMSYMDLMNYVGNHHVHRVDQFTMAFSLEGRFPFLDHELIEAAFRMPTEVKYRVGQQKYVLRNLARKYIASSSLSMKKKGFSMPLEQWMRGPLRELVHMCLDRLKDRPQVNAAYIDASFENYKRGSLRASGIWHLVALELWFERFID
jgi:asparagine synthase (glutamine-hydrolysing)